MIDNKANLLVQLNVGDLKQLIGEAVKGELENLKNLIQTNSKNSKKESEEELLTREQVSKLLKVSYTTLFHWNNDGILPAQKINSRVYYLRSEVMQKLKKVA